MELEYLRQKAIFLLTSNDGNKKADHEYEINLIKNDTDVIRLKRVISYLERWNKLNDYEKEKYSK